VAVNSHANGNLDVLRCLAQIYCELFEHDGYGDIKVEMRLLKRGQKEVIIHSGKQHRFVVDFPNSKSINTDDALKNEPVNEVKKTIKQYSDHYVGPDRRIKSAINLV
jgi:hypothetical protein